jgi:hypothetical protein
VTFKDKALLELYTTNKTDSRKYKKICKDKKLLQGYQRAVSIMFHISTVDRLKEFSFLHYVRLKHKSMSSVRLINGRVERLLFYGIRRRDRNRIDRNRLHALWKQKMKDRFLTEQSTQGRF